MGYEIIAFGTCGETVCTLETHDEDHRAAHALMGALGVDYNYLDQAGPGDTMKFNAGELHAAQAALTVAVNVEEEFTRGMVLLESALEYMKENELSDEELLARYLSGGDLEVLGTLYSRYMSMVYGVCLKYLRNRDDSRDAVISIFEKIAGEHGKHRPENFRAWLYVVTKNFCLMEIRSAASAKTRHEEWSAEQEYFMEPEAVVHPIDKDQRETDKALQECIGKLVSMQRVAIELFYFGNKCYSEIAVELKTDEKRVKSLLQNGKRNLKICLEGSDVRY